MKIKELFNYWPTAIVLCVILYGTLMPHPVGEETIPPIPYIDKLIHAVMMGGLLSAFAFDWQRSHPSEKLTPTFMWAVFGCVLSFSIFDEFLQGYLDNGRDADPWDFLADCVGAFVAVYLAPPAIRYCLRRKRN